MPRIEISKAYDQFRRRIGLSIDEIKQTVYESDKVTTIDLNDLEKKVIGHSEGKPAILELFLKKYAAYYTLTLAQRKEDTLVVNAAFKIFPTLLPNLENHTPIEALQGFIDLFGVELEISGKTRKLFYGEVIKQSLGIRDTLAAPIIVNPIKGHEVLETAFIKISSITYQVFCGLAFCIDYTAYLEFLGKR